MIKKLMMIFLRQYRLVVAISLATWLAVWYFLGLAAFMVTIILSILEITLSADNAVVNSRVLTKLSPRWQQLFLTIGIVIAVFVVRFALPIIIVALTTSMNISTVLQLAFRDPVAYGRQLHAVAHVIDAFGGIFLAMVALFFFVDNRKSIHWLRLPEQLLARLSRLSYVRLIVVALIALIVFLLSPSTHQWSVGGALVLGIAVYGLLQITTLLMERYAERGDTGKQVGWAAFALFVYLQVLDASFSLDGVVGAFAITDNIVIIMAGLGVGALWVRAMTIRMVRHDTLVKYRYLEAGAHWAIACLAVVMFLKLLGFELPEFVIGGIGLACVAAAVISSVKRAA